MCSFEKGVRGIKTGHQMPGWRIMKRWSCAARSPREDQALLLRRRLPLVPRAASPHGGNLAASHNASASHSYRHYTNILSGRRCGFTDNRLLLILVDTESTVCLEKGRVSRTSDSKSTTCPAEGGFLRTNHTAETTRIRKSGLSHCSESIRG